MPRSLIKYNNSLKAYLPIFSLLCELTFLINSMKSNQNSIEEVTKINETKQNFIFSKNAKEIKFSYEAIKSYLYSSLEIVNNF